MKMRFKSLDLPTGEHAHGFMEVEKLKLVGYTVENITASEGIKNLAGFNYSTISVNIALKRSMSAYITQYYIPSTLLVVLSWGSFFVPKNVYPARVAIILTNFLSTCVIIKGEYMCIFSS